MEIILCCWGSLCENGMRKAIQKLGHTCIVSEKTNSDMDYDKTYFQELISIINKHPNASCVISANYIPIVARACKPFHIPYLSLTADCPCSTLYSKTLAYDNNKVFLFDRLQAEKFYNQNPDNIFYLPLACDIERWDSATPSEADHQKYDCDISFVGSLYTEMCKYNSIEKQLSDYVKGYVEGLISAQQNVYGYNFIADSLSDAWLTEFKKQVKFPQPADDYNEDLDSIIADLYLGYKCTEQERINTLRAIGEQYAVDLYTLSDSSYIPNIKNHGPADSATMMPKIFKCSKINLNMTNRAIKSGIPLRVFDILGSGGFLISNYQPEIPEYFIPDEDLVLYESIPDLLAKIEFYLKHDDIRQTIAQNGYRKIKEAHTYADRIQNMLQTSGLLP